MWGTWAPYLVDGRWQWIGRRHNEGNKHAVMLAVAREVGATSWDTSQGHHGQLDRWPAGTPMPRVNQTINL